MVALVGRARRARRHAQTGVGGLSETALPYPLDSPLTESSARRATTKPIHSNIQGISEKMELSVGNGRCSVPCRGTKPFKSSSGERCGERSLQRCLYLPLTSIR